MKYLKTFSIAFLTLAFILSVSLSIILGLSTNYGMVFKDNTRGREKIIARTEVEFENVNYFNYKTKLDEEHYVIGQILCQNLEAMQCKIVEKKYNKAGTQLEVSYMPGDGYKYTVKDTLKTKRVYENTHINEIIETYTENFILGAYDLIQEEYSSGDSYLTYKTRLKVDFSQFELRKNIKLEQKEKETKTVVEYEVNGKDCLEKISYENGDYLEVKKKETALSFPKFDDFVLEG